MDQDGLCHIKVSKKEWIDYQIAIPVWVNQQLTGHIAKPLFIRRKKDNQYIGICSCEYAPLKNNNTGILGVDIGKLKLYSAVAIDEHGSHSNEFIHSKKIQKQKESLDRLNKEYSILYHKKRSYERLRYQFEKTVRVIDNYFTVKNKITRVKADQARLIADEIVRLALELKCKEIHLENLSWLESKAKKWQFAAIQEKILEQAEEFSIKVVRVNAYNSSKMHPITKEVGTVQGRSAKFKQESLDRDFVAAINLAGRNKGSRKERPVSKIKKVRTIRTKIKPNKREIRKKVNQLKGKDQIVFFLPNVGGKGNPSLAVWPVQLGLSKKISFLQKLSKTDGFW